jgi:hypothetical protein
MNSFFRFDLSLISENSTSNSTNVLCKLVADTNEKIIKIFNGDEDDFLHEDELINFLHDEHGNFFNTNVCSIIVVNIIRVYYNFNYNDTYINHYHRPIIVPTAGT